MQCGRVWVKSWGTVEEMIGRRQQQLLEVGVSTSSLFTVLLVECHLHKGCYFRSCLLLGSSVPIYFQKISKIVKSWGTSGITKINNSLQVNPLWIGEERMDVGSENNLRFIGNWLASFSLNLQAPIKIGELEDSGCPYSQKASSGGPRQANYPLNYLQIKPRLGNLHPVRITSHLATNPSTQVLQLGIPNLAA